MSSGPGDRQRDDLRDEAIDVSRYARALRRNALLAAAIVVLCTAGTWVASLLLPPTYEARAELIVLASQSDSNGSTDAQALSRELATLQSLVTTSSVLQPAAAELGLDVGELRGRMTTSVEGQTSILAVVASGDTPEAAQSGANTVVQSLIEQRRDAERARLETAIDNISAEIDALGATGTVDQQQREALIQRRAELTVAAATAGDNLEVAQEAELPSDPSSPRPARNAAIAFFGSLLLALLVALALDRLRDRPRPAGRRGRSGRQRPRVPDLSTAVPEPSPRPAGGRDGLPAGDDRDGGARLTAGDGSPAEEWSPRA
ncbi:YveK family protein [Geodermatophilus sp. SYSU D00684]